MEPYEYLWKDRKPPSGAAPVLHPVPSAEPAFLRDRLLHYQILNEVLLYRVRI